MKKIIVATLAVLAMATTVQAAAGNKCNWASDCGYNEECRTLSYTQRDGSSYRGICVPKSW